MQKEAKLKRKKKQNTQIPIMLYAVRIEPRRWSFSVISISPYQVSLDNAKKNPPNANAT